MRPDPGTGPSMAEAGWTVQSAFYGRNSHATRESSPTPCREAAQSNEAHSVDAAVAIVFHLAHHWRRATDVQCSA